MKGACFALLTAAVCAACGSSNTLPTDLPVSIAGEWTGTLTFHGGVQGQGSSSISTAPTQATIVQSSGMAAGQFTMPGTLPPATFSGVVTGTSFEGSMTVTDSNGCVASGRLAGRVSETSLSWVMPPPGENDCHWTVKTTMVMSRR